MGIGSSAFVEDDISAVPSNYELSASKCSVLNQVELLRREAHQLQVRAKETSEASQREYHCGSKPEAKRLSNMKNSLYDQMNEKKRQAAEIIFQYYNQHRPIDGIDLHGLYVVEALKYLQEKIDDCRSKNIKKLTVITGMGNNSPQNIAKIKPKVANFARKNDIKIDVYDGHVVLELVSSNQYQSSHHQNYNECIIL